MTESGAESPYQEMAEFSARTVEQAMQENASSFKPMTQTVFGMIKYRIEVPGYRSNARMVEGG